MSRRNPLAKFLPAAAVILAVGLILALYGLNRSGGDAKPSPETREKVALATKLLDGGEPEKALKTLDELRGADGKKKLPEDIALLRLKALDKAGMRKELAAGSAEFMTAFPESTAATDVELMRLSSEVATAGLANPLLVKSVEDFIARNPGHEGTGRLQLALARHALTIGDTEAASRRLDSALASKNLDRALLAEVRGEIGAINLRKIFDGADAEVHKVKSGDSVWKIASAKKITPELLMRANGISDPSRLRVGQELRIPKTNFSLACDVARNELTLSNNGAFVKTYSVRTGRNAGTTPEGTFKILNKKTDPTWRPGDGRVYQPGDPNNELGSRWMSFEGDILGIHGTIHPETVGQYASNGCIGMTKEDVEELFDLVTVGTPLTIKGTQDLSWAKVIAAPAVPDPQPKGAIAKAN